ncbi:trans-aconitate 2-methyltransferase [Allocatelliglobosispora scoriae]|uniref:Trans-aconitate 2-methyltransferase n=1 Tax=Allocatelliglobosispora scoriae TaxID=643052 RepID=A0A841C1S5_9ACTN|nr:trans-aconitate 2-methyltransferase [Allocatelliglobosispora scoriae]MBB5873012.1 trans-aconitate 2-methyltransferase [Allocatelliglobosispora scoriae]
MWDPTIYQRYADERSRPFHDLLGRVRAPAPSSIVDLGCGPGNLTATIAERWPAATILGLDSSPEMIATARGLAGTVDFQVADVRQWMPAADLDLLVSNATLQWIPGHAALVRSWAAALHPGAWLAFAVPGNFDAPSHRALRDEATAPAWAARLGELTRDHLTVAEPADYAYDLIEAGCAYVDAWETTYLHLLPVAGPDHPVLTWMEGTALRPFRAALDEAEWAAFRAQLSTRLAEVYPARHGVVAFPFRRLFVVAER